MLLLLKTEEAKSRSKAARHLGRHRNTIADGLELYEEGGLEKLREIGEPGPDPGQQWLAEEQDVELYYSTVYGIVRYDLGAKPTSPRPSHPKKNEQEQIDFQESLPVRLDSVKTETNRSVRLFCQDECRFALMPVKRHRITLPGVKPIQEAKPDYEYIYLYGAVEPETGQRFPAKHDRLNSDCFQVFLDRFAEAFPRSHNVLVLNNGTFHKAKKLSVPRNVRLIFLPPYSPELNPVERLWQDLKDQVAFDLYESLADLRQEVRSTAATYTEKALPSLTGYDYLVNAGSALSS